MVQCDRKLGEEPLCEEERLSPVGRPKVSLVPRANTRKVQRMNKTHKFFSVVVASLSISGFAADISVDWKWDDSLHPSAVVSAVTNDVQIIESKGRTCAISEQIVGEAAFDSRFVSHGIVWAVPRLDTRPSSGAFIIVR